MWDELSEKVDMGKVNEAFKAMGGMVTKFRLNSTEVEVVLKELWATNREADAYARINMPKERNQ